jgi:hypothetical protein
MGNQNKNNFYQAAIELIGEGYSVFPCKEDKTPFTNGGFKDATTETQKIKAWADTWPQANVAIACAASGLVVVDIDNEKNWQSFLANHGFQEPKTLSVRTPGDGRHLYFTADACKKYPGQLCSNVDVKHNGYVLSPPSEAYSKRTDEVSNYAWVNPKAPIAAAPHWLQKEDEKVAVAPATTSVALSKLNSYLSVIDPDSCGYDQWVKILMCIHEVTNGSSDGLNIANAWSKRGEKFCNGDVDRRWKDFKKGKGKGLETIISIATEHGYLAASETDIHADLGALSGGWLKPDMSILKPDQIPSPRLSENTFKTIFGSWAEWIQQAAHAKGAPAPYVVSGLLASIASCIGNKFLIQAHSGWKEPIALWIANVGEPSSNKSPGLDAAINGFEPIKKMISQAYEKELKIWKLQNETAKAYESKWKKDALKKPSTPKPDEAIPDRQPHYRRVVLQDVTIEKVADVLSGQPTSLLLLRDELAGYLLNMGRYSNGSDREFLLESYGGRSYTVDRKSLSNPQNIDHLLTSLCGNIQPEKLRDVLLEAVDDGLTARMLFFYPEPVKPSITSPSYDSNAIEKALRKLDNLKPHIDPLSNQASPKLLSLSRGAFDKFNEFRIRNHSFSQDLIGGLASHVGKYPGLCLRIAAVFTFADWAFSSPTEEPTEISDEAIQRSILFIEEVAFKHAERIYLTSDPDTDRATKIAQWILYTSLSAFSARDVYRAKIAGINKQVQTKAPLKLLMEAGWLSPVRGKKGSVIFQVNPSLGTTTSK